MKQMLPMLIAVVIGIFALLLLMVACASDGNGEATLKIGDAAPEFSLSDQNGKTHALRDYRGQYVLLYFYPKDDTPGCTKQACTFRDLLADFTARKVPVFGINADSVESHKTFAAKYNLNFPLLADTDKTTVKAYGVWGVLKVIPVTARWSFLVDPQGKIAKIYPSVSPTDNPGQILKDLDALGVKAEGQ